MVELVTTLGCVSWAIGNSQETDAIFNKPKTFSGNFLLDDTFLTAEGVTDFDRYRADPTQALQIDFFVPDDMPPPKGVSLEKLG